jgi:5-methyltetrahydropteroyltriglutamate--homocysteine methyltransferase
MAAVDELRRASYQGGAGPGIYDVHSLRVPEVTAIEGLLRQALEVLGPERLWVNPDCGLKTRRYAQVLPALDHMVTAAHTLRAEVASDGASLDPDRDPARTEAPSDP